MGYYTCKYEVWLSRDINFDSESVCRTVYFLTRQKAERGSDAFLQELKNSRGRLEVFVNYMNNNLVGVSATKNDNFYHN